MKEKRHGEDDVSDQELRAFKPVALPVRHDRVGDKNWKHDGEEFEQTENQIHFGLKKQTD